MFRHNAREILPAVLNCDASDKYDYYEGACTALKRCLIVSFVLNCDASDAYDYYDVYTALHWPS